MTFFWAKKYDLTGGEYLLRFAAILYIVLIDFRVFDNKSLSLADVVFVLILLLIALYGGKFENILNAPVEKEALLFFVVFSALWVMSYVLPMLNYTDKIAFLKSNAFIITGAAYLVVVSMLFYYLSVVLGRTFIIKGVFYSGFTNAVIGIVGLVLFALGFDNDFITQSGTSSPYLLGFPRLKGFSLTSNAYAYLLFTSALMVVPLYYSKAIKQNVLLMQFATICAAIAMTLSKTVFLLLLSFVCWFAVRLLYANYRYIHIRRILFYVLLLGLLFYLVITHIVIQPEDENCTFGEVIDSGLIVDGLPYHLCPSLFVQQKKIYFDITAQSFPWGIGASNTLTGIQTPHSTYLERASLHGLVGVLSLIAIFLYIGYLLNKIKQNGSVLDYKGVYVIFTLFWIMHLYLAINEDVLRYRELWMMMGITFAMLIPSNVDEVKRLNRE